MSVWMGNALPAQEPDPPQQLHNIGDRVRHVLQRPKFTKGGLEWSRQIYTIVDKRGDRYVIAPGANADPSLIPIGLMSSKGLKGRMVMNRRSKWKSRPRTQKGAN